MNINFLPEEVFLDIVKYLPPDDLISCTLVCSSWRNAINKNEIWHRVCKNLVNSSDGGKSNSTSNLVTDNLQKEPYSAVDFEPLCKWRISYMKWERLKNNWRKGNYQRSKITTFCPGLDSVECCDDVLLLVSDKLREFLVWDLKSTCKRYSSTFSFLLEHVCSQFVKFYEGYLVIVQCTVLQVIYNTDKGFHFLFACLFDKDESFLMNPTDDLFGTLSDWYIRNVGLYPCDLTLRCEHNGNKFVGTILEGDLSKSVLHIWDLPSNRKIVEERIPNLHSSVTDISFSVANNYLYIIVSSGSRNCYDSMLMYDLQSCQFLEFKLNFNYKVKAFIFCKTLILSLNDTRQTVDVWKFNSNFHKQIVPGFSVLQNCFKVIDAHLVVGGKKSRQPSTTIIIYNLINFKCLFRTDVKYPVDFLSLIQSTFLLLGGFCRKRFLSVIDITKNCDLYKIENEECIFVNATHSKLITIMDEEVNMISFW